jgi:hypothetical protein
MQMHSVLHALLESNVYVEPAMQPYADPEQVAAAVRDTNATNVQPRIVVVERLPSGTVSVGQAAQQIYQTLNAGKRELVVLVAGHEIAAQGGGLTQENLNGIVQGAARTFDSESYAAGIAQIVRAADQERGQQIADNRNMFLLAVALLAVGLYLVMRRKRKRNAARLNEARERACGLSVRLAPQLETLHSEYSLLENNGAGAAHLVEHRRAAAQAFADASKALDDAQSADEFEAALTCFQRAEATIQQARDALRNQAHSDDMQFVATQPVAQDALSST